jgi:hypothetical protein
MARASNLRSIPSENVTEEASARYNDLDGAMKDLKFAFRRITTQLDGDLKMANLEHAGPANKDKRRKAAVDLLKEAKKTAVEAFDVAIGGMA